MYGIHYSTCVSACVCVPKLYKNILFYGCFKCISELWGGGGEPRGGGELVSYRTRKSLNHKI